MRTFFSFLFFFFVQILCRFLTVFSNNSLVQKWAPQNPGSSSKSVQVSNTAVRDKISRVCKKNPKRQSAAVPAVSSDSDCEESRHVTRASDETAQRVTCGACSMVRRRGPHAGTIERRRGPYQATQSALSDSSKGVPSSRCQPAPTGLS